MIEREKVIQLAEEKLDEGQFLVEVTVSSSNVIHVVIDGMQGVNIAKCVEVSRNVEHNLDRETEDFELEVASAGLGQPFKVLRQYEKNLGRDIEILKQDGTKAAGKLLQVTEAGLELEVCKKEKVEGKKTKQLVCSAVFFLFNEIKEAKNIIKF